jgi:SH3-like domain-containing protein
MAAGHFFIGLAAGLGILAMPVLVFTPAGHVLEWIQGSPAQTLRLGPDDNVAASRPASGYHAGDPTPVPQAVPTLQAMARATVAPTRQPVALAQAPSNAANMRWAGTAVIRSGGAPVTVRRIAGVDSGDDPQLADGSPVLIGAGPPLQQGGQQWQAVRALNGIVGWVPSAQLAVDGQASTGPIQVPAAATPTATVSRATIANTGGSGVVLRNSPNDTDRSRVGLLEGTTVSLMEYSGSDWVRVRADNGQTGWVPARYVKTS